MPQQDLEGNVPPILAMLKTCTIDYQILIFYTAIASDTIAILMCQLIVNNGVRY